MKIDSEYHTISGKNIVETNLSYKEYREKWHSYPKKHYVDDFPLFLDIDITDICNLKCSFCLRQSNPELIQNKMMTYGNFTKIINEGVKNNLYGCKLSIIGEPLIHKRVFDMIRYAKDKGLVDVYFNTNGFFLDEDNIRRLIISDIDRISISFEGYTKKVYEHYRVGSDFDRVVNNIIKLQKIKKNTNIRHPKVRIQTVMLPEIESDIDNYINFWKPIVDEIGFLDYQPRVDKYKSLESKWECPQLWQRMGILVDGTIIPCNHDERKLCNLGNIKDTTIKEAWHSDKMNQIREYHMTGKSHLSECCKDCYLRHSEILKLEN